MNIDKSLIGKTISDIRERFPRHGCCDIVEIYFTDGSKTTLDTEVDGETLIATITFNDEDFEEWLHPLEDPPRYSLDVIAPQGV